MSWQRTFVVSLVGMTGWFSTRCALTWKVKDTKSARSFFQLQASTRRTAETEFGSWLPTPTRFDYNSARTPEKWEEDKAKYAKKGINLQNPLKQHARLGMLPTPTAKNVSGGAVQVNENGKRQNKGGTEFSAQLHDLAKSQMLPTPTASSWNHGTSKERPPEQPSRRSELNHLMAQEAGKNSQLSPLFVEEMMGFPPGWTASPFQSGAESQ